LNASVRIHEARVESDERPALARTAIVRSAIAAGSSRAAAIAADAHQHAAYETTQDTHFAKAAAAAEPSVLHSSSLEFSIGTRKDILRQGRSRRALGRLGRSTKGRQPPAT
jgi:hypothetical protein